MQALALRLKRIPTGIVEFKLPSAALGQKGGLHAGMIGRLHLY